MKTKYVFIDIDGTLLSHSLGIPKSSLEAIDLARRNGHKVFINTGRVQSAVDDYLQFYPFDGFIFGAGSHVKIKDQDIYLNTLETKQVMKAIEIFDKHDIGYILEGANRSYYNPQAVEYFRDQIIQNEAKYKPEVNRHLMQENMVNPISEYFDNPTPICKFSIFAQREQILQVQNHFDNSFQFIIYDKAAEIVVNGINKATGIEKVLSYYGGSVEDTLSLGDSMNDYEMTKFVNTGIAMGNAVDKLKEVADYITFDVNDNGFYHAFKHCHLID